MKNQSNHFKVVEESDWQSVKKWVDSFGDNFDDLFWINMIDFTFCILQPVGTDDLQVYWSDYIIRESQGAYTICPNQKFKAIQ